MEAVRLLKCKFKNYSGDCNLFSLMKTNFEINLLEKYNRLIDKMQKDVNDLMIRNNVEEIIALDIKYKPRVDELLSNSNSFKYIEPDRCQYSSSTCNFDYVTSTDRAKSLTGALNLKVEKYNQNLRVFKDLKFYIKQSHTRVSPSFTRIRFGKDHNGDLICLFFDINKFLYEEAASIYVFFGDDRSPYESASIMTLEYKPCRTFGYAKAEIIQFKTRRLKQGGGAFILDNLEWIIRDINKVIINMNKIIINVNKSTSSDFEKKYLIREICGEVAPIKNIISKENLIKFYHKHGFKTVGKQFQRGFVCDGYLYRTIDN